MKNQTILIGAAAVLVVAITGTYLLINKDDKQSFTNKNSDTKSVSTYTSANAKLTFIFPEKQFVVEAFDKENAQGNIQISKNEFSGDSAVAGIQITYGVPEVEGKGGACENWQQVNLYGQPVQSCESESDVRYEYPKNTVGGVEYAIYVSGTNAKPLTPAELEYYKSIVFNNIKFDK